MQQATSQEFLNKLIKLILKIIPVESCLIYFYDREKKELILVASKKPHEKLMGKIKLRWGEGITGWVAAHKKTAALTKEAYKDNRFKFFEELPEDRFEAFLSVPIIDREGVVGVINLQNKTAFILNFFQSLKKTLKICTARTKRNSCAPKHTVFNVHIMDILSKRSNFFIRIIT